jgi:hypothetical protein
MGLISILLSSCAILGVSFSTQPLQLTSVNSKQIQVKCSDSAGQKKNVTCDFSEESPTQQIVKHRQKKFKISVIDNSSFIFSDESNSEFFQVKGNGVVYHQRLINDIASLEKVCVGSVSK